MYMIGLMQKYCKKILSSEDPKRSSKSEVAEYTAANDLHIPDEF